jgi:NTP pyrophosphatase (non-canonical NTP hydrolase)
MSMSNIKKFQSEVSCYDKKYGWDGDGASHIVLHLAEELGEISRGILRYENYKTEKFSKNELAQELTDLLYLTLKLANKFDIDLDGEWKQMWKRYEKKVSRL